MNDLLIRNPVLLVGIGGAGSRIAKQTAAAFSCKCMVVSNDGRDIADGGRGGILVETGGWINPSVYKLRSFTEAVREDLVSALAGYQTVILVSNLAGHAGAAMSPVISMLAKQAGATVISVAIMPFKFEKDRLFAAGTAFRRLRETCDSVIVMDNDAFLDSNPELTQEQCYQLTNEAITEVLASVSTGGVRREVNVLCTSKSGNDSESALRDSVTMLYHDVPEPSAISRTMLYVVGGERVPVGDMNKIVGCMEGMFKTEGRTEVAITSTSAADGVKVHLMATAEQKTRFDRYDPLGDIFPKESVLDWDEPESAPEIVLPIPIIE